MTRLYIGIDPGVSGAIAMLDEHGAVVKVERMPLADQDLLDLLFWPVVEMPLIPRRAVLEKVSSSPVMGVVSAFSFGGWYRAARMALAASHTPYDEVLPRRWQRALECLSGGDKHVTRVRAQQLFPGIKVTHALADALLLAEYCRRLEVKHVETTTTDNEADGVAEIQAGGSPLDR